MEFVLNSIEALLTPVIGLVNTVLWNYVLVYGLLAVGVYFTVRLKFLQLRRFPHMLQVIGRGTDGDAAGISPFQALCTSLASRVGTGNLAGVAIALSLGGPGALFWMWVVAALGMATAYAESALAQLYKVRDEDGQYRGGPGYYMSRGLKLPWLGVAFSVCLVFSYGLIFSSVHANAMAQSLDLAFGLTEAQIATGLVVLTALTIFGGVRSVARVAEWVVPFMAVAYLGLAAAMLNGVKRGLYSNEAGMGSAPNIAAAATPVPHHPASQGLVQSLGVFIDTLLICTATGLMILLSGVLADGGDGVVITQNALVVFFGPWGSWFAAIALFFFAFTTILGNYSYAESGLLYLGGGDVGLFLLRVAALGVIVWGVYAQVPLVWSAADAAMAMMATLNLVALLGLSGVVVKLTRDYDRQLDAGRSPMFHIADYPELADGVDHEIWRERDSLGR